MRSRAGTTLLDVCILICVALVMFAVSIEKSADECRQRAIAMKAYYSWKPKTGCLIETESGKWVPLANYRESQ